ncbi:hypothetical protein EYF80_040458 [Liparis tanakae]|uniref:Uncharacterized protein n=1 Tax=Liparis tanakae TaxID=230148 RepID=A0A4Z2G732_9TELE|nr:hypothetical protein EYF80_040458 [Liparis tanakae]
MSTEPCMRRCVFAGAYVLRGEVKQSTQPSLTAAGQASHVTAGDQCQTGEVTGRHSHSLHSFKKSCGQKKVTLEDGLSAGLRFGVTARRSLAGAEPAHAWVLLISEQENCPPTPAAISAASRPPVATRCTLPLKPRICFSGDDGAGGCCQLASCSGPQLRQSADDGEDTEQTIWSNMHHIEFVDGWVMGYSHVCDLLSGYVFIVSGNQSTAVVFNPFTSAAASH